MENGQAASEVAKCVVTVDLTETEMHMSTNGLHIVPVAALFAIMKICKEKKIHHILQKSQAGENSNRREKAICTTA